MIQRIKEAEISQAVYNVFRENERGYKSKDEQRPPILLATLATYLFCLLPSHYYSKIINCKMEKRGKENTYVIFSLNGVDRLCPILNQPEAMMMSNFISYRNLSIDSTNFTQEYLQQGDAKFSSSRSKLYEQVHNDSLSVFKALEMPLEEQKDKQMAIKALRDLRIADLVINQHVDYGFIKTLGLGFRHQRFFENNRFRPEIEQYFKDIYAQRSVVKYPELLG